MNHLISLEQAIRMTSLYRAEKAKLVNTELQGKDILANSESFDATSVSALLAQPGCTRLRIYYGMDDEKKVHAILVGVNEDDTDMLKSAAATEGDGTIILEEGFRCPTICPPVSELNNS